MDTWSSNFFIQFSRSIANVNFYRAAARQKMSAGVVYLLILSFVCGLIAAARPAYEYNNGINLIVGAFDEEVPDFILEDGQLHVEGEMPLLIGDYSNMIIIDTRGEMEPKVFEEYDNAILILKDRFIQKTFSNRRETYFSSLGSVTITKDIVTGWLPYLKWFNLLIIAFTTIGFIAVRYISAFIASLLGLAISSSLNKVRLPYAGIFNLSAYSLTLPIILTALFKLGAINIRFFWLIYFIISAIYLWVAFQGIKKAHLPEI
jgi:hypothetical protein